MLNYLFAQFNAFVTFRNIKINCDIIIGEAKRFGLDAQCAKLFFKVFSVGKAPTPGILTPDLGFSVRFQGSGFFHRRSWVLKEHC